MTPFEQLIGQIKRWVDQLVVDLLARPPVIRAATFAAMQTALASQTRPCHFIVTADETTLNDQGVAQRVTYWFDGVILYYPALIRADGTVTTVGSDSGLGLAEVADNAALLAAPAVYRTTLFVLAADTNNEGAEGFYIKRKSGKIYWIPSNLIN